MTMPSVTLATRQPAGKDCECGCADCASVACNLDCIERPRFFCGQLLTDQDLTALVTWAQERMRLLRFRDGWGVVCGLELRASPDGGGVVVGPGYAVSDCGDDVIVCADSPVYDLGRLCGAESDCMDPQRWRPGEGGAELEAISIGGFSVPVDELRAFDLYLSYAEEGAQPQTALSRGGCGQAGLCEFGRTREIYRLTHKGAALGSSPAQAELEAWLGDYNATAAGLADVRSWEAFEDAITTRPPRQFPFLARWRAELDEGADREAALARAVLWLLLDRRNAFLNRPCRPSPEGPGLPLGRVLVRAVSEGGKTRCRVLAIDAGAPYRRAFAPAAAPAPEGELNLGRFLWQPPASVALALADLGLAVATQALEPPATVAALQTELQSHVITAGLAGRLTALYLETGYLGRRVVGFRRDMNPAPDPGGGSGRRAR